MLRLLRGRKGIEKCIVGALAPCVARYAHLGFQFLGGDYKIAGHSWPALGERSSLLYRLGLIFALNFLFREKG